MATSSLFSPPPKVPTQRILPLSAGKSKGEGWCLSAQARLIPRIVTVVDEFPCHGVEPVETGVCSHPDDPGPVPADRPDQIIAYRAGIPRIVPELHHRSIARPEDREASIA